MEDVVPVADPGEPPAAEPALPAFVHREQVGDDLARMLEVVERVDHGDRRGAGEFDLVRVFERPVDDRIDVAREHPGGVCDRLAPSELHIAAREVQRVTPEVVDRHLERRPSSGRRLLEDEGDVAPEQRRPPDPSAPVVLQALRAAEERTELAGDVGDRQQVALRGRAGHEFRRAPPKESRCRGRRVPPVRRLRSGPGCGARGTRCPARARNLPPGAARARPPGARRPRRTDGKSTWSRAG